MDKTAQPRLEESPPLDTSAIALEFSTARDWRVVFEKALQQSPSGGGFYALRILVDCSAMRERTPEFAAQPANSREQDIARQLYQERCASFSTEEISPERILRFTSDMRLKNDPLRALSNEWDTLAATGENKRRLVQKYLDRADPLLLEGLGGRIFSRIGTSNVEFEGHTYTQEHANAIFNIAWLSAICAGTGIPCDSPLDRYAMDACATRGLCMPSRRETLARMLQQERGDAAVALFRAVEGRLGEIIRARDAGALVP